MIDLMIDFGMSFSESKYFLSNLVNITVFDC